MISAWQRCVFLGVFTCSFIVCQSVFAEVANCDRINRDVHEEWLPVSSIPLGRVIFNLIIEVLIERERAATLISVGLKVLHPMVRMTVRGRIDRHRSAALHFICLFYFLGGVYSYFFPSTFFLSSPYSIQPSAILWSKRRLEPEALCVNSWVYRH